MSAPDVEPNSFSLWGEDPDQVANTLSRRSEQIIQQVQHPSACAAHCPITWQ